MSIEQRAGATQRMCEMDCDMLTPRHHPRRRMIQYSATPIFYAVASDYRMPAFAGMTVV
jgi:hypothetical protein